MRHSAFLATACLLAFAGAAAADPASDRCEGDKACLAAVKAAGKPNANAITATAYEMRAKEAKAFLKTKWMFAHSMGIDSEEKWEAYFATPAGRKMVNEEIARRVAEERWYYNKSLTAYTSTLISDGRTTSCTTTFSVGASQTTCN